jgi:phosphate transport system substrate-binding protein
MNLRIVLYIFSVFMISCAGDKTSKSATDSPEKGTIYISVDESFKPVMEQQIKMYEASFPETHIIPTYKSEADCFRDLFSDTLNRLVVVGRGLNKKEERFLTDSLTYNPGCNAVASDAIAIVINSNSKDTLFTTASLKSELQGKNVNSKTYVFDGLNATSTVRFIKDSILKGEAYDTSVVKAVKTSQEVLNYVSTHENAVGFLGISWIGNPEDSAQTKLLQKVKIAFVQCDVCEDKPYVKPMQESMITRRYPLVRSLFYINKENYKGLGTGFVAFLKSERGQLIFRRAYLGPIMDFEVRKININEKLSEK